MRKIIPFINGGSGPTRSTTPKNLDTFYAALMAIVGHVLSPISSLVLAGIGRIFYRVTNLMFGNPAEVVKTLKAASAWYVHIVRGADIEETHPFDGANDFFTPKNVPTLVPNTLLWLRKAVMTQAPGYINAFDQIVFALLSIHRVIVLPPVIDFSTITNPSEFNTKGNPSPGTKMYHLTDDEIRAAFTALGINTGQVRARYRQLCKLQTHMIMSSAGPNGKASWTAYSDAIALLNERVVLKHLISFAEQSGLSRFINHLLSVVRLPAMDNQEGNKLYSAKIHTFEEWGGKTRNVAIVDYWTQLLLTPLHDLLFGILKTIKMDATFDQDGAAEYIRRLTANSALELYSVDLSAATDRLPASLQVRILTLLLGNQTLATAWAKMFSDRYFHTIDNRLIQYAIGLPMGSKSNWGMLALTHHIIVQVAAARAKAAGYDAYRVCGDDVTLANSNVYMEYIAIMNWYCVTINYTKSIVHSGILTPAAEFCKRIFVGGVELTTIPVKLIVKTVYNGRLVSQLQNELTRRSFSLIGAKLFDLFAALVDRESLEYIMILNALPRSINGLHTTIREGGVYSSRAKWFGETHNITRGDLIAAYTFVLVTEQLKRLDALLRQTEVIAQAIEAKTGGFVTPQLDVNVTTADGTVKPLLEAIGWKHPEIEFDHPIAHAAFAEIDRINNLLSNLRSSDAAVSTSALMALLDAFRNALIDSWQDPAEARGQAERSLITRAMSTLADIISKPSLQEDGKTAIPRILEFTISLAYIQRVWSVRWVLGQSVELNAVKTRIITSPILSSTKATTIASDFNAISRFARGKIQERKSVDSVPELSPQNPSSDVKNIPS